MPFSDTHQICMYTATWLYWEYFTGVVSHQFVFCQSNLGKNQSDQPPHHGTYVVLPLLFIYRMLVSGSTISRFGLPESSPSASLAAACWDTLKHMFRDAGNDLVCNSYYNSMGYKLQKWTRSRKTGVKQKLSFTNITLYQHRQLPIPFKYTRKRII